MGNYINTNGFNGNYYHDAVILQRMTDIKLEQLCITNTYIR